MKFTRFASYMIIWIVQKTFSLTNVVKGLYIRTAELFPRRFPFPLQAIFRIAGSITKMVVNNSEWPLYMLHVRSLTTFEL